MDVAQKPKTEWPHDTAALLLHTLQRTEIGVWKANHSLVPTAENKNAQVEEERGKTT